MEISTSIADISPSHSVGNGRTGKAIKVAPSDAKLEANIVTFLDDGGNPVSLIGLDSMMSSTQLEQLIKSRLCNEAHRLLIVASHTHHAPVLSPRLAENYDYDPAIVEHSAQQLALDIEKNLSSSFKRIEKVKLGSSVTAGNVYRRKKTLSLQFKPKIGIGMEYAMAADPDEPVPKELHVYVAEYSDGGAAFVIWSWTCHATSVAQVNCFSADYPGVVREHFRKVLGNKHLPVIYLPGFCGDIRPDSSSFFTFNKARVRHPFARLFKSTGQMFFDQLCDRLATCVDESLQSASAIVPTRAISLNHISVPTRTLFVGDGPEVIGLSRFVLAGLELILVGAEVSYGFQELLKVQRDNNCSNKVLYSGLYGDVFGYLPTERQVDEGGYEPDRSQATYGISGEFQKNLDQRFVDVVNTLYD